MHTTTSPMSLTGRRRYRRRPTASSPTPRSAGSSHCHRSMPSRVTTSTSGANTTRMVWAWAAVASRRWRLHNIRAAGLLLDMLERAGCRMHTDRRCVSTQVSFNPFCGWAQQTPPVAPEQQSAQGSRLWGLRDCILYPPYVWMDSPCTNVMVWCTGNMEREVRTKGWTGVHPQSRARGSGMGLEWRW
jgi:hypothetical protein